MQGDCLARIFWFASTSERKYYTLVCRAWHCACSTAPTPCIRLAVPRQRVPQRMAHCHRDLLHLIKRKRSKSKMDQVEAMLNTRELPRRPLKRFIAWDQPIACNAEWTPLWRFGFAPARSVLFLRGVSISCWPIIPSAAALMHIRYLGEHSLQHFKRGRIKMPPLVFDPHSFYVPEVLVCDSRGRRIQCKLALEFCHDFDMSTETCGALLNALQKLQVQYLMSKRVSVARPQAQWAPCYIQGQGFSKIQRAVQRHG